MPDPDIIEIILIRAITGDGQNNTQISNTKQPQHPKTTSTGITNILRLL